MALGHGPTVVTNGLVLALDAADINSFDKNENLLTYTSNIGGPNGYLSTTTATPNTSETLDPNGTSTATKLDNAGNVNTYTYSQSTTLSANTTYTYSIHIKQGTKPDFSVTIDENSFGGKRYQTTFTYSTETITTSVGGGANDGVLVGSSVTKLTNGWYRLSITFTTSTTSVSTFVDMMNRFGNTPGTNYVWGRQLEIGTSTNTYYATTGTAKTRGSTIIDLSGNGNTGTLTNGPTFNSANGGSIVFDGTNDQIDTGYYVPGSARSYFVWIKYNKVTSLSGGYALTGTQEANAYTYVGIVNGGAFYYYGGTTGGTISGTTLNSNIWYQQGLVIFSDGSRKLYLNGVEIYSAAGSVGNTATVPFQIGRVNSGGHFVDGNIAQVQVYNRALTAAEIQQNFNAIRSRFGV